MASCRVIQNMAFQNDQFHFLLVPLMSQSHLIPFTDFAKLLAQRGLTVTVVMTPLNAERSRKTIDYSQNFNLKIQFLSLPFPCKEAGLPEGCENMDLLPNPSLASNFFQASNMVQSQLDKWLQELENRPHCIISDICLPCTAEVAQKFNIPRIIFHGISCFTLLCSSNLRRYNILESVALDSDPFLIPGIHDRIEFTKSQLPEGDRTGNSQNKWKDLIDSFKEAELSAQGVVVNSFEELEPTYLKGYQQEVKKVWCVGPVSLINYKADSVDRSRVSDEEEAIMKWLDSKEKSSVLYVCFGSLCQISTRQLIELGLGLEDSHHPFIWVIRKGDHSAKLGNWLKEEKFEERLGGRGLIIRGWAPQVLILAHPSIGGFLTHCGWNSTLEGISAGLPMVTWPMFAEQFYNEKLIVQVLKIGVRVGVEVSVSWGEEEKIGAFVKEEDIRMAVEELMDGGEEGEGRRRRAKELGEMAKRAVKGGSSCLNITLLIQHVMQQVISAQNPSNVERLG